MSTIDRDSTTTGSARGSGERPVARRSSRAAVRHAVRLGMRRGWAEFVQSLRSSQDQWFYLIIAVATLGFLWSRRDSGTGLAGLTYPTLALPGILGGLLVFGVVIGPAYALAMEREDGTLLRHRAIPGGMTGYVSGQLWFQVLNLLPLLTLVLVPAFLLFDGLMADPAGWVTVLWVLVLGLLATMPIGMVIGALVPGVQKVGMWGMLPVLTLASISGIFFPLAALWGWVQVVAQVFPMYWIGLGMRSAFLPEAAAAAEVAGSWRTPATVGALLAWAVLGALVTPVVLRRMARRQSGSTVAAARESAGQWTR